MRESAAAPPTPEPVTEAPLEVGSRELEGVSRKWQLSIVYSPGCLPRLVSYEDVKLKDSLRSSLQFLLIAELYELGLGCWNSLNKVMEFKGMVLLKILECF